MKSEDSAPVTASTYPGLNKPTRENTIKIDAVALKPPQHNQGPNGEERLFAVFVTRGGKEERVQCTDQVFTKIRGKHRKNREHTGLDFKLETSYTLHKDPKSGKIVSVDVFPNTTYRHNFLPENPSENVILSIGEDGSITVTEKPPQMRETKLVRLLRALDVLPRIERGMSIDDQFQVEDIVGSTVTLSFTGEDENEFEAATPGAEREAWG